MFFFFFFSAHSHLSSQRQTEQTSISTFSTDIPLSPPLLPSAPSLFSFAALLFSVSNEFLMLYVSFRWVGLTSQCRVEEAGPRWPPGCRLFLSFSSQVGNSPRAWCRTLIGSQSQWDCMMAMPQRVRQEPFLFGTL